MRIVHFEDLLVENNIDINSILLGIFLKKFKVSLKLDGSPAFVCGHTKEGFFVALKNGYDKKEQELFFSPSKIEKRIESPDLRDKLILLWETMRHIESDVILRGDFLFHRGMLFRETNDFRSNTVRYSVGKLADTVKIGVAIHSVNGIPGSYFNDAAMRNGVFFISTEPLISYKCSMLQIPNFDGLTNNQRIIFKKWVNSRIREGNMDLKWEDFMNFSTTLSKHVLLFSDQWQSLMDAYMFLATWKNRLLETLETDSPLKPVDGHQHEGIVIDTGDKLIKMVNRLEFSYRNFNNGR